MHGCDEHRRGAPERVRCAVVTVSDTRTPADDASGGIIRDLLEGAGHALAGYEIVPDDVGRLRELVGDLARRDGVDLVVVNGGTGIAPRDGTWEAVSPLLDKAIEGFGEIFRSLSYDEIGPAAMLSRAFAGIVGGTPVFCMPGSPAAVRLAMERLILPEMGHIVGEARKGKG